MNASPAAQPSARTGGPPGPRAVELVCPDCRAPLPAAEAWPADGVRCGCGAVYRADGGIPRFVQTDAYAGNFSFEWLTHHRTQLDRGDQQESEQVFGRKTGLTPELVRGKRVLDAGCGMGRFAEVASRWGGQVTAVDLSRAVESARNNLAGRANAAVYQADLRRLPFPDGGFDIIYSMGVLHHTPDCEASFRGLTRLLAPGGLIVVWLYADDQGLWAAFADAYRRVTTKMPSKWLHLLCHAAVPYYYLCRLPLIGRAFWTVLPVSMHPKAEWRILDTFDWYSPRYQSKHTYPQVHNWFVSEGLIDIRLLDVPVAVSGRRAGVSGAV